MIKETEIKNVKGGGDAGQQTTGSYPKP